MVGGKSHSLSEEQALVVSHSSVGHPAAQALPDNALEECGVTTVTFWPMVNLSASFTITTVAAIAHRQEGHPLTTGSSFFDR